MKVVVERAWAQAQKPVPNFRLAVNKPHDWRAQFSEKLEAGSSLNFIVLISIKLGLEAGSREIIGWLWLIWAQNSKLELGSGLKTLGSFRLKNENKPPHEKMKSRCLTGRQNFERLPLRNKNGEKLKAFAILAKGQKKTRQLLFLLLKKSGLSR